jgi:hypothetical protein
MKGLADEYGPGKSSMHPKKLAAALYHGSDAGAPAVLISLRSAVGSG